MTTVAHKQTVIGADKRRTQIEPCGAVSYDDSVVKVFKFQNIHWGQAGMVGLTELLGYHIRGFDVSAIIREMFQFCADNQIPKERVLGQVLVYDGTGRYILQVASTGEAGLGAIERADIGIDFFSIGSGSQYAFPILMSGGTVEDAISYATIHDEGTGGGVDMAHLQDDMHNNIVSLTPKPTLDTVNDGLKVAGFMNADGQFTDKSVGYTATTILNFQELAKLGIVKNVRSV